MFLQLKELKISTVKKERTIQFTQSIWGDHVRLLYQWPLVKILLFSRFLSLPIFTFNVSFHFSFFLILSAFLYPELRDRMEDAASPCKHPKEASSEEVTLSLGSIESG